MSQGPFELAYTDEALAIIDDLKSKPSNKIKWKKVRKALLLIEQDPRYPGLNSHPYQSIKPLNGGTVWESYVENHTPSAWRIWWEYGPQDGDLTIVTIGPHP